MIQFTIKQHNIVPSSWLYLVLPKNVGGKKLRTRMAVLELLKIKNVCDNCDKRKIKSNTCVEYKKNERRQYLQTIFLNVYH